MMWCRLYVDLGLRAGWLCTVGYEDLIDLIRENVWSINESESPFLAFLGLRITH